MNLDIDALSNLLIGHQTNDAVTRRLVELSVSEALEQARRHQQIQGFVVICDESNNPEVARKGGWLNCDLYIYLPGRWPELTQLSAQVGDGPPIDYLSITRDVASEY